MLMTRQGHDARNDPTLAGFWAGQRGWRRSLALRNAQHFTFTDLEEFLSQLLAARILPAKSAGTSSPGSSVPYSQAKPSQPSAHT